MMKKMDNVRRRNALFHFGFGTDVMKNIKICEKCSHPESSMKTFCTKCGSRLPKNNLYDFYKAQHKNCQKCGTVLNDSMDYCPRCGAKVNNDVPLMIEK